MNSRVVMLCAGEQLLKRLAVTIEYSSCSSVLSLFFMTERQIHEILI